MTDVAQNPQTTYEHSRTGLSADALRRGVVDHLRYSIGRPVAALKAEHYYRALALAVRDRMQDNRVASTQTSFDLGRKVARAVLQQDKWRHAAAVPGAVQPRPAGAARRHDRRWLAVGSVQASRARGLR
jgi:hypothetical protein